MRKLAIVLGAVLAVLSAGWSGMWVYFRGEVAGVLDAEEARLAEAGGTIAYAERSIGGFPAAFRVAYGGLRATLPDGTAVEAPTVTGEISALEGGAMRMALPPEMVLTLPAVPGAAPMRLALTSQDMVLVSRATEAGGLEHVLSAGSVALARIEGGTLEALTATAEDFSARMVTDPGDPMARIEATAALASFGWRAELAGQGTTDIRISLVDGALALATDRRAGADILRHVAEGRDLTGRLTAASLALDGTALTPGGPVVLKAEAALEAAGVALDDGAGSVTLALAGLAGALDLSGTGQPLPPLAIAAGTVAATLALPLTMTEAPAPVSLTLDLGGVTADEAVWAMVDPGGALGREAIRLRLDLAGTGIWRVDPLSLARMPPPPGVRPFDLPDLTLTGLTVAALGAEVTATGAAEIPQDAPVAEGRIDVAATGLRGVLGRLEEAGLIGQTERMVAGGFLAAYSVPGAEPDSLTTEVRFGRDGVIVNGKPIRAATPAPVDAPLPPAEDAPLPPVPAPDAPSTDAPATDAPVIVPAPGIAPPFELRPAPAQP